MPTQAQSKRSATIQVRRRLAEGPIAGMELIQLLRRLCDAKSKYASLTLPCRLGMITVNKEREREKEAQLGNSALWNIISEVHWSGCKKIITKHMRASSLVMPAGMGHEERHCLFAKSAKRFGTSVLMKRQTWPF